MKAWKIILTLIVSITIIIIILKKYREKFLGIADYTYVNSPDITGVFPTYAGGWHDNLGLPYLYWYPRGFSPYLYPYRTRYPFRARYPYAPRYPWRYSAFEGFNVKNNEKQEKKIENFQVNENVQHPNAEHTNGFSKKNLEKFVGSSDERNYSCVNNQGQMFSGYPEHGFAPVCDLRFPRDIPPKMPTKLDIPMITATKSAKNYQIGEWVHFGKGYANDMIVDVFQFNINPAKDQYYYVVRTDCGQTFNLDFNINVYGLEDGYRFFVPGLNKIFLLRKDYEFAYAWR